MTEIHPTAIIENGAQIGAGVKIGPYCVVGDNVKINDGSHLFSHAVVTGDTIIGKDCKIYPFASIGHAPQDLKYKGEKSKLEIGDGTVIRENVTLNPGTKEGGLITRIGKNCLFMVGAHVAHDCKVGDNVVLANYAEIGGHVVVGEYSILGGLCAIHQRVRIGAHSIIGGLSAVVNDVIPYGSVTGERGSLAGLNIVGLKRRGFPRKQIHELRSAYKELFDSGGTLSDRMDEVSKKFSNQPLIEELMIFLKESSSRGLCVPRKD